MEINKQWLNQGKFVSKNIKYNAPYSPPKKGQRISRGRPLNIKEMSEIFQIVPVWSNFGKVWKKHDVNMYIMFCFLSMVASMVVLKIRKTAGNRRNQTPAP